VQTLVEVLVELKRLGASDAPDKLERIAALPANPRAPAELGLIPASPPGVRSMASRAFGIVPSEPRTVARRVGPACVHGGDRSPGGSHA